MTTERKIKILFFLLIIVSLVGSQVVFAQKEVGILPTSSFYFLKEFRRDIQRFFSFGVVSKAKVELEIIDEMIAEIIMTNGAIEATTNYQKSLERLEKQFSKIKKGINRYDVNSLIDSLIEKSLRHNRSLGEVISKQIMLDGNQIIDNNSEILEFLEKNQKSITKLLAKAPGQLISAEDFKERFNNIVDDDKISDLKELQAAEMLNQVDEYLDESVREDIRKLKNEFLVKFRSRIENLDLDVLKDLILKQSPANLEFRLNILDEVRQTTSDTDLRSRLNIIRQEALEQIEKFGVNEKVAGKIVNAAEVVLKELEIKISSKDYLVSVSAKELAAQAKFNLEQARLFLKDGDYVGAFGSASAALASAENSLGRLRSSIDDFKGDLQKLKERFDKAVDEFSSIDTFPYQEQIRALENSLVNFSQAIAEKVNINKVNSTFDKAQKLLIELEQRLEKIIN